MKLHHHQQTSGRSCHEADLQGNESECFKCALQVALVDEARRVHGTSTVVVVVLRREDEGCKPEVGQDPGKWGKVALVGLQSWQDECGKVKEGVNSGLRMLVGQVLGNSKRVGMRSVR